MQLSAVLTPKTRILSDFILAQVSTVYFFLCALNLGCAPLTPEPAPRSEPAAEI